VGTAALSAAGPRFDGQVDGQTGSALVRDELAEGRTSLD